VALRLAKPAHPDRRLRLRVQESSATRKARHAGRWLLQRPWVAIGAAALVGFLIWAMSSRREAHHVTAAFSAAVDITPGLDVQLGGVDVGRVGSVNYEDGHAVVTLGIGNNAAWPLHQGTRLEIRYGTTIGDGTRNIQILPGPRRSPVIPDGGVVPTQDTVTPVEFDQLFNTFDKATRVRLRAMLANAATAVGPRANAIGAGLGGTPRALHSLGGLFIDLASDQYALSGLLRSGSRFMSTLGENQGQVESIISGAASTFHAFAQNTEGVKASIEGFPPTLEQVRSTLARLDPSIDRLQTLTGSLARGAALVPRFAALARPALHELGVVGPLGTSALGYATREAPDISRLLAQASPFATRVGQVTGELAPMMACVRPYAPEIAGLSAHGRATRRITTGEDTTCTLSRLRVPPRWIRRRSPPKSSSASTPGSPMRCRGPQG
jgi:virulence factor Mce-like protein